MLSKLGDLFSALVGFLFMGVGCAIQVGLAVLGLSIFAAILRGCLG